MLYLQEAVLLRLGRSQLVLVSALSGIVESMQAAGFAGQGSSFVHSAMTLPCPVPVAVVAA